MVWYEWYMIWYVSFSGQTCSYSSDDRKDAGTTEEMQWAIRINSEGTKWVSRKETSVLP